MTDLDRSVAEMGLGDFAQALASGDPVPGGGAAAGVVGALGASLTAMVVRLSLGRPKYAEHAALHQEALEASDAARVRFLELAEADAAAYAAYRLVLEAPADLAVDTLLAAHDRHTLGPLTEVVTQRHTWSELAARVPPGPLAGTIAVERVLRGDDLADDPRAETHHLDVPAHRLDWEGRAPEVQYRARDVLAPAPVPRPVGPPMGPSAPGEAVDDPELVRAWEALVAPWATSPDGRVDVAVADGPAPAAAARLVPDVPLHPVALPDVVGVLTWAASTGGSRQRRRGGAAGRSATWWALRVLVDHEPGSPVDELRADLAEWSWFVFDGGDPARGTPREEDAARAATDPARPGADATTGGDGWVLRLAGSHPDGWSLAIAAHDPPPEDLVLPVDEEPEVPDGAVVGPATVADPWAALDRAIREVSGDVDGTGGDA